MKKKHLTVLGIVLVMSCSIGIWQWIPVPSDSSAIPGIENQLIRKQSLNRIATSEVEKNSPLTDDANAEGSLARSNPKWLSPIITNVLNSKTTWNETGNEKTVTSIVEVDFHHPFLRVEEIYKIDVETGEESLQRYVPSSADTCLGEIKRRSR